MAVIAPLGSYSHDYDRATGTERFLLSLDLVGQATLGLASLLTVRLLASLRPQRER